MQSSLYPFTIVAVLISAGVCFAGSGYLLRGRRRGALVLVGVTIALAGAGYGGLLGYGVWRESSSPSTGQVLVLRDGRTLPLVQPTERPASAGRQAGLEDGAPAPQAAAGAPFLEPQAQAASYAPAPSVGLPPLRIRIPQIEVDWPVVLSTNEHLPRFQGVGWLMGSGFPGKAGNIVLFGHLGGPYGTFMRLHELRPGDELIVYTESGEHRYRVRTSYETTPDDVAVLAPTDTPTATLITCSGPWDAGAQTNERRLIVLADYIAPVAAP